MYALLLLWRLSIGQSDVSVTIKSTVVKCLYLLAAVFILDSIR